MPNQGDPRFDSTVSPISCQAGIKRDGTVLDGNFYSDGSWCRFRLGRPKKIGGYREIIRGLNGPIRGLYVHSKRPQQIVYTFSGQGIQCSLVDDNGVGSFSYDRTPAGFAASDIYLWQYDVLFDSTGGNSAIIAHPGQNLNGFDQSNVNPIYFGDVLATGALVDTTGPPVSGGIVVLQPFLFAYGDNGLIQNSEPNKPGTWTGTGGSNTAHVAGTKVVVGLPLRGGSASPAGLFWSLDSLIRVTFVGGTAKWNYDTLTTESTILCANGVIDYDGVYYWAGIDRFLMYNGVVKEVPNLMNQDFFFDNLNFAHRQKVWVTKISRWGEIWWFFPRYPATECNWAIVYNVREGSWYDTPIVRSAGYPARVLAFPVWADSSSATVSGTAPYRIYRHEFGQDAITGEDQLAIDSFFETSQIGFASGGQAGGNAPSPNIQTRAIRVEPDFVQSGAMTVSIKGGAQARDATNQGGNMAAVPFASTDAFIDLPSPLNQKRMMTVRFDSNVQGGNYHMGKVLLHLEPGDSRS